MFVLQFHESSFFFKLSLCVLDPSFEHHVDIFWNTIDSTGQNPPRFFLHLCLPFLPSLNSLNVTSVFASVCSLHLHYSWPPLLNLILSEFLQSPGDPFLVRGGAQEGCQSRAELFHRGAFLWNQLWRVCRSSGSNCFPQSCGMAGEGHCHLSAFALPWEPCDDSCFLFPPVAVIAWLNNHLLFISRKPLLPFPYTIRRMEI